MGLLVMVCGQANGIRCPFFRVALQSMCCSQSSGGSLMPVHRFLIRSLLEELLAIARVTRGKETATIDLSPVGEDFDSEASL